MKIKSIVLGTLMTSAVLSASTFAADDSVFKVAVINSSISSGDVISGKYEKAIATLKSNPVIKESFEESTSLCVAYIKSGDTSDSLSACSSAIENIASVKKQSSKVRYLHSLSYSNRAVARYLKNDVTGAMNDLTSAVLLSSNSIVKSNLSLVKNKYTSFEDIDETMSAE